MRRYSCDSHVVEPPEVFEGLSDRFGDRAPYIEYSDDGVFLRWPLLGRRVPVGRFGIAGHRLDDPATHERIRLGWKGMNPGVADPVARLAEQDQDGVAGEVMYPSLNMLTYSVEDAEVSASVFARHNDWIRDYCTEQPNRLIGVACVQLFDVEQAVLEVRRVARMGIRGIAIPCTAPPGTRFSDQRFDPFWAAVDEVGLPLTMHIFCGSAWSMGLPDSWGPVAQYALSHSAIWNTVTDLICGGVAARFPGIKFVCAEWETGWVGHLLERTDHAAYRSPAAVAEVVKDRPSEYFHRQFFVTFEDDALGIRDRDIIGIDRLLWGNDYPHHDSIWPRSEEVLNEIMQGVPYDEVDRMV